MALEMDPENKTEIKTKTVYLCPICQAEYDTEAEAQACSRIPIVGRTPDIEKLLGMEMLPHNGPGLVGMLAIGLAYSRPNPSQGRYMHQPDWSLPDHTELLVLHNPRLKSTRTDMRFPTAAICHGLGIITPNLGQLMMSNSHAEGAISHLLANLSNVGFLLERPHLNFIDPEGFNALTSWIQSTLDRLEDTSLTDYYQKIGVSGMAEFIQKRDTLDLPKIEKQVGLSGMAAALNSAIHRNLKDFMDEIEPSFYPELKFLMVFLRESIGVAMCAYQNEHSIMIQRQGCQMTPYGLGQPLLRDLSCSQFGRDPDVHLPGLETKSIPATGAVEECSQGAAMSTLGAQLGTSDQSTEETPSLLQFTKSPDEK